MSRAPPPGEVEPTVQKVIGEVGRRRGDAEHRRGKDPFHPRRDRVGHFRPRDHDRAHDAGRDVAASNLDLVVLLHPGAADGALDALGGGGVDGELEVAHAQSPDGLVEVSAPERDRGLGDEAAESQHPDLGCAGAHVDDHRRHRLLDPQPGAERNRDLLLHETDLPRPRLLERPVERPSLHAWSRAPDAQHSTVGWAIDADDPPPAQELAGHRRGEVEIEELAVMDRPQDRHLAGAAAAEAERRRLPKATRRFRPRSTAAIVGSSTIDAATGNGHERPRRPEIDGEVGVTAAVTSGTDSTGRAAKLQSVPPSQVSLFQIGVVAFRVSMMYRQASNASARCGVETATTTEASPSRT